MYVCCVRGPALSLGLGGGGVRGWGFSSWYCRANSKSGLGSGSEVEKVMRSSTVGGSVIRGMGWEISSSKEVRSSKEGRLFRGGTLGGISKPRPSPIEARIEPVPSRARCVFLNMPPKEPRSGIGELAGE